MNRDYTLKSKDDLTELAKSNGLKSWNELAKFIKNLPYGRNKNRTDLGLVLSERKGTCSSKHALLKAIADLNEIPNIKLILGIYKMNHVNTPKIGTELLDNSIPFIPEAHCYLKVGHTRVDLTSNESAFAKIEKDIMQEIEIEPEQVSAFKVTYHKAFLKTWIINNNFEFSFSQLWEIRERCIENLSRIGKRVSREGGV